jgi:hypothetical protein
MKQVLLTGAALLMTVSAAFAQTSILTDPNPAVAQGMKVRQELASNLRQAGFTDVRIIPDSFLVQAKDKSGNPVTMFISPNSMTVSSSERVVGSDRSASLRDENQANVRMDANGRFTNLPAQEDLSSKVVGLDVYNVANQDIGKIKDIAFDDRGVRAYIVAVGGFLGMGDHYVAVKPSAIDINYDASNRNWHATMNTDADQLKAAPEYKYSSND